MRVIIILFIIVAITVAMYNLFPLIQVCGDSMYPTYCNSEIILGTKLYRKSKLKKGDVIIYNSPKDENRAVIKRIDNIMIGNANVLYFYCLGDNAEQSYDSRNYGYISSNSIVCKVVNQRRKY